MVQRSGAFALPDAGDFGHKVYQCVPTFVYTARAPRIAHPGVIIVYLWFCDLHLYFFGLRTGLRGVVAERLAAWTAFPHHEHLSIAACVL